MSLKGNTLIEGYFRQGFQYAEIAAFLNLVHGIAITVMIQFSAPGIYLLLVPQGRVLIRDRALI